MSFGIGFQQILIFFNSLPQYDSNLWGKNRGVEKMNINNTNLAFISILLAALIPRTGEAAIRRSILKNTYLQLDKAGLRSMISVMLIIVLSATVLMSIVPFEAQAAGGAYTLKWYAADPALNNAPYLPTYAKLTPAFTPLPSGTVGRQADPLANAVAYGPTSSNLDAVTSLAPQDMALGQIVPYEMVITVSGSTAPENGNIQFHKYL